MKPKPTRPPTPGKPRRAQLLCDLEILRIRTVPEKSRVIVYTPDGGYSTHICDSETAVVLGKVVESGLHNTI